MGGLRAHAELIRGTWPGPAQPGKPIPGVLPARVAALLHLTVGGIIALRDARSARPVPVRVTGLYLPHDPASPYWGLNLIGPSGVASVGGFTTYGPLIVSPAAFGHALTSTAASWVAIPDTARIPEGDLDAVAARVRAQQLALQNPAGPLGGLRVTTSLPAVLRGVASDLVVSRSLIGIGALELFILGGAALAAAARLLAGRREAELALLAARGGARWQLAGIGAAEALLLAGLAAIAGTAAGGPLAWVLARGGPLRAAGPRISGTPPIVWLALVAGAVAATAIALIPVLRPELPGLARVRRGRRALMSRFARVGADVTLIALAALAVWQIREYSVVARSAQGTLGVDPVLVLAPALALAAGTAVLLRLLPLAARVAERAAPRRRKVPGALAIWQFSRRPLRQAGPALLVVLAVATGTLALSQHQTWVGSAQAQASFRAGAQVRVDTQLPASPAQAHAITAAPGVRAAMPVARIPEDLAAQALAVDASQGARTALLPATLAAGPARALFARIAPRTLPGSRLPGREGRFDPDGEPGPGIAPARSGPGHRLGAGRRRRYVFAAGRATPGGWATAPAPGQPWPRRHRPGAVAGRRGELHPAVPAIHPGRGVHARRNRRRTPSHHTRNHQTRNHHTRNHRTRRGVPLRHRARPLVGHGVIARTGEPAASGAKPGGTPAASACPVVRRPGHGAQALTFAAGSATQFTPGGPRARARAVDAGARGPSAAGHPGHRHPRLPGCQQSHGRLDRAAPGGRRHGRGEDRGRGERVPDRVRTGRGDRRGPGRTPGRPGAHRAAAGPGHRVVAGREPSPAGAARRRDRDHPRGGGRRAAQRPGLGHAAAGARRSRAGGRSARAGGVRRQCGRERERAAAGPGRAVGARGLPCRPGMAALPGGTAADRARRRGRSGSWRGGRGAAGPVGHAHRRCQRPGSAAGDRVRLGAGDPADGAGSGAARASRRAGHGAPPRSGGPAPVRWSPDERASVPAGQRPGQPSPVQLAAQRVAGGLGHGGGRDRGAGVRRAVLCVPGHRGPAGEPCHAYAGAAPSARGGPGAPALGSGDRRLGRVRGLAAGQQRTAERGGHRRRDARADRCGVPAGRPRSGGHSPAAARAPPGLGRPATPATTR